MQINDIKIYVATLICTAVALWSCKQDSDVWEIPYTYSAEAQFATLGYNQTINTITTTGNPNTTWTAVIDNTATQWCSFDTWQNAADSNPLTSGRTGDSITVYTKRNDGSTDNRTATITVKFSNGTVVEATFIQNGISENAAYDRSWGEQPENTLQGDNFIYKTYYTTLSGRSYQERNYSVCYDTEKMVSRWVAYPVHSVYLNGSTGRSEAWAFDDAKTQYQKDGHPYYDYIITSSVIVSPENPSQHVYDSYTYPIIPHELQQNIEAGSYGDQSVVRNLNRGHMLPSATRQNTWDCNAQTYYATNMMPQNGYFNSGVWATLEGAVRSSRCNDTLYVVVGTLFEQDAKQITSRNRRITVPSHCFKLMLRTKTGNTGKSIDEITDPDQLQAIGFVFSNQDIYTNPSQQSDSQKKRLVREAACSIKDLEERSGFVFFRNLNPAVAEKVKSTFNTDDWAAIK